MSLAGLAGMASLLIALLPLKDARFEKRDLALTDK
jgi:hypothetical protein